MWDPVSKERKKKEEEKERKRRRDQSIVNAYLHICVHVCICVYVYIHKYNHCLYQPSSWPLAITHDNLADEDTIYGDEHVSHSGSASCIYTPPFPGLPLQPSPHLFNCWLPWASQRSRREEDQRLIIKLSDSLCKRGFASVISLTISLERPRSQDFRALESSWGRQHSTVLRVRHSISLFYKATYALAIS